MVSPEHRARNIVCPRNIVRNISVPGTSVPGTSVHSQYARQFVALAGGIKRSTFFDTVNDRGVEQLLFVFSELQKQTAGVLPSQYAELGDLVAINGSLIDSVLSMH